ncbi:MAG: DUF3090 family protein [Actinobacteria bacterium]|nr:DUF3090 family protein [Actinomycetota bacterium]
MLIELDPVDRITADAVGPPGQRVFYLQGRRGDRLVSVLVEKQQVQLLAASVVEILSRIGKETAQGPSEEAMNLEQPIVPEWRAGRLSIGYQEERDLLLLEAEELLPEQDEEDGEEGEEGSEGESDEPGAALGITGLRLPGLDREPREDRPNGRSEEEEPAGEGELSDVEADLQALTEAQGRGAATDEPSPGRVRFWATREQMLSLARHGATVCAKGRPRCQLCGQPMDGDDHRCPALNGHREQDEA